MSCDVINLCSFILREHFGPLPAKVCVALLENGPLTLPQVASLSRVQNPRKYLAILVRHAIVTWDTGDTRGVRYTAHDGAVLCRLRIASLVRSVGEEKNQICELICEEIILHGAVTETGLIQSVTQRAIANAEPGQANVDEKNVSAQVRSNFKELIKLGFINILKPPEQDLEGVPADAQQGNDSHLSNGGCYVNGSGGTGVHHSQPNVAAGVTSSVPILWKVNLIRLQRCLLNQIIVDAIKRRFGDCAKICKIVKTVIELVEEAEMKAGYANTDQGCDFQVVNSESVQITLTTLNQTLSQMEKTKINNFMLLLTNDRDSSGFIKRIGEASGGQFVIEWQMTLKHLATSLIQSVIKERFGGESLRIFTVLLHKGFLEQKEIETFCLLAGKDVKQQLYTMLEDGFLTLAEIPRVGTDYAPARTNYFFGVDLPRCAGVVLGSCVKACQNMMQRRTHEIERQQNLLDKNERLENLKDTMRANGCSETEIEEVGNEWLGVNDRQQLEQFALRLYTLDMAEITIDQTLFILRLYINSCQKRPLFL